MALYKQDPNNTTHQVPVDDPIKGSQYSNATCPVNERVTKRPTYVNVNSVGTYAFLYSTTSSIGGNVEGQISNFETGSKVVVNHGNVKLDISPVAWRRTDGADSAADVTFVYVRVR